MKIFEQSIVIPARQKCFHLANVREDTSHADIPFANHEDPLDSVATGCSQSSHSSSVTFSPSRKPGKFDRHIRYPGFRPAKSVIVRASS